jgi:phospholipase C
MKPSSAFWLVSLLFALTLLLAGCGGAGMGSTTPPPTTSYQLTVTAPAAGAGKITGPAGINCPGTCTASFAQNTKVTLTATPGTNYTFGGFSGACSGMTCTLTITSAVTISATFTATSGEGLTVTLAGTGQGTVASSPGGISCTSGTCTANFPQNTKVTLTATAGTNSSFGGWTGGGCSGTGTCIVTLTAAVAVTASFSTVVVNNPTLTVTLAGTGQGTVASTPGGINCTSGTCTANFPPNTQITLTETPGANSSFTSWSGCTGTTACTFTLTAATTVTATFGPAGPFGALNHIILFADENRSFDHYFGFMRQYWANNGIPDQSFDGLPQFTPPSECTITNGVSSCAIPSVPGCNVASDVSDCTPDKTNQIPSFSFHTLVLPSGKQGTVCEENQSPFWNEAHNDWDYTNPADQPPEVDANGNPNPPLNGFVFTAAYDARSNAFMDVNGVRAMGYFEDSDLNFYYALATDFGTSDRWFSPVMDRTQINRAYIYAATSQGYAYPPGGGVKKYDGNPFTATTIFEALENAGITWKIYIDPQNVTWTNPTTLVTEDCSTQAAGQPQDLCLAGASYMNMFTYETTIQNSPTLWQHFATIQQFQTDLQDEATFPQFAYIEPASSAGLDEHPSDTDFSPVNVQLGAQYVQKNIVNYFLASPTWNDSAMIFTYDEAGGLYDHVSPQPVPPPGAVGDPLNNPIDLVGPPPTGGGGDICTNPGQVLGQGTCTFGWTGYRVPLVVISPYAKKNFVSHTVRDTTAVLAMVETRFGLSPLTNRDAYYVPGTTTDYSMDEFFDFVNKPWATPPTLAAQSLTGICDQTPAASWNEPPLVTAKIVGGGNVSSSPAFVQGFEPCTTWCTVPVAAASTVTLTATPNAGSTFTGWSGACTGTTPTCTLTAAGQQFATATFNP